MGVKVWQYPRCGTCRKALKWMDDRGIEYERVHIVDNPPQREELRALWERSGLPIRKLFNTSGQAYRAGNFKERLKELSDEEALDELANNGKLIKRPIVDLGQAVLIGFNAEGYVSAFNKL